MSPDESGEGKLERREERRVRIWVFVAEVEDCQKLDSEAIRGERLGDAILITEMCQNILWILLGSYSGASVPD